MNGRPIQANVELPDRTIDRSTMRICVREFERVYQTERTNKTLRMATTQVKSAQLLNERDRQCGSNSIRIRAKNKKQKRKARQLSYSFNSPAKKKPSSPITQVRKSPSLNLRHIPHTHNPPRKRAYRLSFFFCGSASSVWVSNTYTQTVICDDV